MSGTEDLVDLAKKYLKPVTKRRREEYNDGRVQCRSCCLMFDNYQDLSRHLMKHIEAKQKLKEAKSLNKNLLEKVSTLKQNSDSETHVKKKNRIYHCTVCKIDHAQNSCIIKKDKTAKCKGATEEKETNDETDNVPVVKLKRVPIKSNSKSKESTNTSKTLNINDISNGIDKIIDESHNKQRLIRNRIDNEETIDDNVKIKDNTIEATLSDDETPKLYQCASCKLFYVEFDLIKKHSKNCNGYDINKTFAEKCNKCNIPFFYKELEKHNLQHHNNDINEFDVITVINSKRSKEVTKSNVTETDGLKENIYRCSECGLHFGNKKYFLNHVTNKRHGTDEVRHCVICGLTFYFLCYNKHLESHEKQKKCFSYLKSMYNEIDNNKLYQCNECEMNFLTKTSYDRHIKSEKHNISKIMCHICDKYFSANDIGKHFSQHIKTSNSTNKIKEKNTKYATKDCKLQTEKHSLNSKSNNNKNVTRFSQAKHNETNKKRRTKRPKLQFKKNQKFLYKCEECEIHFISLGGLKNHMLNKAHNIKGYNCKVCGYKFSNLSLQSHMNIHHRDLKMKRKNFLIRVSSVYNSYWRLNNRETDTIDHQNELNLSKNRNNDEIEKFSNEFVDDDQSDIEKHVKETVNNIIDNILCNDNSHGTIASNTKINTNNYSNFDKNLNHYAKRVKLRMYSCEDCKVCFVSESKFCNHINKHELINKSNVQMCKYCGYYFLENEMTIHVEEHHKVKSYVAMDWHTPSTGITTYGITELLEKFGSTPLNYDGHLNAASHNVSISGTNKNTITFTENTHITQNVSATCLNKCRLCKRYIIVKNTGQNIADLCSYCTPTAQESNINNILIAKNTCNSIADMRINKKDASTNTNDETQNLVNNTRDSPTETVTYKVQLESSEIMREYLEIDIGGTKVKLHFLPFQPSTDGVLTTGGEKGISTAVNNSFPVLNKYSISPSNTEERSLPTTEIVTNIVSKISENIPNSKHVSMDQNASENIENVTDIELSQSANKNTSEHYENITQLDENFVEIEIPNPNYISRDTPCTNIITIIESDEEDCVILSDDEGGINNINSHIIAVKEESINDPVTPKHISNMKENTSTHSSQILPITTKVKLETVDNIATLKKVSKQGSNTKYNATISHIVPLNTSNTNSELLVPKTEKGSEVTKVDNATNKIERKKINYIEKTANSNSNNVVIVKLRNIKNESHGDPIIKIEDDTEQTIHGQASRLQENGDIKCEDHVETNILIKVEAVSESDSSISNTDSVQSSSLHECSHSTSVQVTRNAELCAITALNSNIDQNVTR